MSGIGPDEIRVFSQSIAAYFELTTREKALVRSAYLLEIGRPPAQGDFSGIIYLSGSYGGSVSFSSSRKLLSHVLLLMGEKDFTDEAHRDIVGEIANTMSGRARMHFGEGMEISPPVAYGGREQRLAPRHPVARGRPYAIPFAWRGYEAQLVVHMEHAASVPRPR
jgi:chemotaxis protein CheX